MTEREKRPVPLRTRRRRLRIIASLISLATLSVVVYGVHVVSYLPQFNVNRVIVVGTERVSPELVRAFVESQLYDGSYRFISRNSILLYPRADIERAIVDFFPGVSTAHISGDTLVAQDITVGVVERQLFAEWCLPPARAGEAQADAGQTDCYGMDESGFVFMSASSTSMETLKTSYRFSGGLPEAHEVTKSPVGETFIPGHMPGLLALLRILEQQGDFKPTGATVLSDQDFLVNFAEGFSLKASFGEDANTLSRNIQLVTSSDALKGKEAQLEYIDLRFGNRVYYKLKGQEQTTSAVQ